VRVEQSNWGKEHYTRLLENIENQIDHLVYQLYGLTEEEIKIVDGNG